MLNHFPGKIADGVFALGNRHFFNFLVTGKCHALVELGVSCTAPEVVTQLEELGMEPDKIGYLVVPHAHFDHLGGLPYFRNVFPRARVVCSRSAAVLMAKPEVLTQFFQEDTAVSAKLEKQGKGRRTFSWLPGNALQPDVIVGDGDILDLDYGTTLKFYAAPGHSPCSMAVYLPKSDTLLVSDSLGFFLGPEDNFPIFFYSYRDYLDSIFRLKEISAATVAAAHEFIFTGEEATNCFDVAFQTAQRLFALIQNYPGDPVRLIGQLYGYYYRDGLAVYSPENIRSCIKLLLRRVNEL